MTIAVRILNEVLSITAQECGVPFHSDGGYHVLNEVLSITAQECNNAVPADMLGISSMKS